MEEDEQILSLILKGQTAPYEKLVLKYQNLIFSIANSIVKNEQTAKDITQDCFVKAYRYLQNRHIDHFKNFICRMATNQSIDYIRRETNLQNKIDCLSKTSVSIKSSAEEDYIKKEETEKLHTKIKNLPEKYREILTRYYFNEQSYAQIAEECGLRIKTVETRLYRAKKQLKKTLEEESKHDMFIK